MREVKVLNENVEEVIDKWSKEAPYFRAPLQIFRLTLHRFRCYVSLLDDDNGDGDGDDHHQMMVYPQCL